jgi:hypothetical protein
VVRSIFSKVIWVGRATVFMVGLSVILALVFGLASTAFAHKGDRGMFHLGHRNVASAVSTLVNNGVGPALNLQVSPGEPPLTVNSSAAVANLNADKVDGQDANAFLGANQKATDADMLDGKNSSDFQPSNPCPSGTLFHDGACIETAKRATAAFPNAEGTCLNAGRRLPTVAELQTFRLRQGHDFDTQEYTSHIWSDTNGTTQNHMVVLVAPTTGTQRAVSYTEASTSAAFRCVAAPNEAIDAWESAAQVDLRNASAAATSCAANNNGSYVPCGTAGELQAYGFSQTIDVIYMNFEASPTRWASRTQHASGGSAFEYDTATGEMEPIPRF